MAAEPTTGARRPKPKRAALLASQIEREVVARGWPVGDVFGSEAELLEQYGVSRAVFREAVRLLESRMIAQMRRGPGGGLVVTAPNAEAVVDSVALLLEFGQVEPRYLFETRKVLELTCVQNASEAITEQGIGRLRALLADEARAGAAGMHVHSHDFHIAIAELSGNPVQLLFVQVLTRLSRERAVLPEEVGPESEAVHLAHQRIADAIVAGDSALAQHRMAVHLDAVARYVR